MSTTDLGATSLLIPFSRRVFGDDAQGLHERRNLSLQDTFYGYLRVKQYEFRVTIETLTRNSDGETDPIATQSQTQSSEQFAITKFQGDELLAELLSPCRVGNSVHVLAQNSATLNEFLNELSKLVENVLSAHVEIEVKDATNKIRSMVPIDSVPLATKPPSSLKDSAIARTVLPAAFYERVLYELEQVGWENVIQVDESFQIIVLQIQDVKQRKFELHISISAEYPRVPPSCAMPLPVQVDSPPRGAMSSFVGIQDYYSRVLGLFEDLFDSLEDFDAHCWVLEPNVGSRTHLYRRLALGNHCSLYVELDPWNAKRLPNIRVLGSKSNTARILDRWNTMAHLWDIQALPRENLQRVLDIAFVTAPKDDEERENFMVECAICYSYVLNIPEEQDDRGSVASRSEAKEAIHVPDTACENAKCARMFHHVCLKEWFRSVPSTRTIGNMLASECPYCQELIQVFMEPGKKSFI